MISMNDVVKWTPGYKRRRLFAAPTFSIALCGSLLCAGASAAEWEYAGSVDQDGQHVAIFIDHDSIASHGAYRTAWTLSTFSRPQAKAGIIFQSIRRLRYFDCHHRTAGAGSAEFFASESGRGPVLRRIELPVETVTLSLVETGTPGATALNAVCHRRT